MSQPVTVDLGLPDRVTIRDVGPRDGLQPEAPVSVADRIALIHALQDAGIPRIEVAAFVSPKAVPAMAGAADVVAGIRRRRGVTYAALVPNRRGAELALEAGVDEITVTISVSETYNVRNVNMSIAESEAVIGAICQLASPVPVDAVISCAFGSPYEADVPAADIAALGRRLLDLGCAASTYADTTGMATPSRVHELVAHTGTDVGLHLHQTRGTALLNAFSALGLGVTRFDTSIGGLGGSPFAHGAAGNLATEELVAVLDDCGVTTGIDIDALLAAATMVEALVGHPLPSAVARAGPRTRRAPAQVESS
jgi:hydroxymethylglutaryl-CoA lyase